MDYNNSVECDWTLHSLLMYDQTFFFVFGDQFDLEGGANCEFDALDAYLDGDNFNYDGSEHWYTFCGHDKPAPFAIPGPGAMVNFHSNAQNHFGGFSLTATMKPCGGVFGGHDEGMVSKFYI